MPADASIYGRQIAPRFNTPFENLSQVLQVRNQQQAGHALAEQRRASADKQRQDAEQARQEAAAAAQVRSLFSRPNQPPTPEELASVIGPDAATNIFKGFEALKKEQWANQEQARADVASVLNAVMAFPTDDLRAKAYDGARQTLIQQGKLTPEDAPEEYSADFVQNALMAALSPEKIAELNKPPADYSLGDQRFSGATNQPIATAREKVAKPASVQEYEYAKTQGFPGTFQDYQNEDANRRRPVVNVNAGTQASETADAPVDPDSQDIMSHAGLSYNGFLAATGRMSLLARDQHTRNRASAEVAQWARSRGMDVATLASQYKAYNETLESNIQRYNRTVLAEGEIAADVENLLASVKKSGLGDVRAINAAKQWLRGELNDPNASEYAFYLNQLTNDIALYNAASQGRATLQADTEEAKSVVQRGVATGSLNGLQEAITQSVEKMGVVLEAAVNRSRKNVWDLFGVGDKYKPVTRQTGAAAPSTQEGRTYYDADGNPIKK